MGRETTMKLIYTAVFTAIAIAMTGCNSSTPGWEEKNQALIKRHNLTARELSTLPQINHQSNLEPAKVSSVDKLISTELYPNVNAKMFWGTGAMGTILELGPGAKIPEEMLTAD